MAEPYVGQMVHFVDGGNYASRHLAAVVVYVWEDTVGPHTVVNLNVQNPGTSYPTTEPIAAQPSISHDEEHKRMGTWHFIEDQPYMGTVEVAMSSNSISTMPMVGNV